MGGIDTLRGVAFQVVQTLSDVVDLALDERADAVRIEGDDDFVDYEILDHNGRRLAVRQAKTRQGSDTWGAADLAEVLCDWGRLADAEEAEFAFVTDGRLGSSGRELHELIRSTQTLPDAEALRASAARIGRKGVTLPRIEVLQRVQILTEMGSTEHVLARLERQIHRLLETTSLASTADAENATLRLFMKLFLAGGKVDPVQRTISRAELISALGIDERSLQGGLVWSDTVASRYRMSIKQSLGQQATFVPLRIATTVSTPRVLRLLESTDASEQTQSVSIDVILDERVAVLVGVTGQGKTLSLSHIASLAAAAGQIPVMLTATGHVAGSLARRVRNSIEDVLGESLKSGAMNTVMALPDLLLLIDGVSEVDDETQMALRNDLQRLAGQRTTRVMATGRDLVSAVGVVGVVGTAKGFQLTVLNADLRREIASKVVGVSPDMIDLVEVRLGSAIDNPMLFLMALSVSGDGVPTSRAEVYERFLQGLSARAGAAGADLTFAAFGVAWADMIGRNQRTADRYAWLAALATALTILETTPTWRGRQNNAQDVFEEGRRIGLLSRLDPDGGLAPLHDSFADYLAARAMARGEAATPNAWTSSYDESQLLMAQITGHIDEVARRLVKDDPLLACRLGALPEANGLAEPVEVGMLLDLLVYGCELPLLGGRGLRIIRDRTYTGVVLIGDGRELTDHATFTILSRDHAAIVVPPDTGSLQLAVRLWATAVRHAQRPAVRVFQATPPADPEIAGRLLLEHAQEVDRELVRLVNLTLPPSIRGAVLTAVGPRGMVASIGEPQPGLGGDIDIPISYRRHHEHTAVRATDRRLDGPELPFMDTAARKMRRHPTHQAASEIEAALKVLTDQTWPS